MEPQTGWTFWEMDYSIAGFGITVSLLLSYVKNMFLFHTDIHELCSPSNQYEKET